MKELIEKIEMTSIRDRKALLLQLDQYSIEAGLPFLTEELIVLSVPIIRIMLRGENGFDLDKGVVSYCILSKILQTESNAFSVFSQQKILRELAEMLDVIAQDTGVDLSNYFRKIA